MNDVIVAQYVRVLVDVALLRIYDVLKEEAVWAFYMVGDGSTHHGQYFFDL